MMSRLDKLSYEDKQVSLSKGSATFADVYRKEGEKKSVLARLASILRHKGSSKASKVHDEVFENRSSADESELYSADANAESEFATDEQNDVLYNIGAYDEMSNYENSVISDLDDILLVANHNNAQNFAGTSMRYESRESMTDDDDSVRSYYLDEPEALESIQALSYDREKELYELRVQFMKEMSV